MAPKTGTKRQSSAPKTTCNKKVKADPQFDPLLDAVKRAELPEAAKQMLLAVIPGSFGVPQNERHEAQEAAVGWVGIVIEEVKAKMAARVETQTALVEKSKSSQDGLMRAVKEAEENLEKALKESLDKEQLLLVASRVAGEKKELLEAAKTKQAEGDKASIALQSEKDKTEALLDIEFKFLSENEEREEGEVKKHVEAIQPITSTLDDSVRSSFVTSCEKAPSARGTFDNMVMEQAKDHFKELVAKLEEGIAAAAPGKVERAAVVEDAQKEFDRAKEDENDAQSKVAIASEAKISAARELGSKKDDVKSHLIEHHKLTEALQAETDGLEQFETRNIACFTLLKDKRTDIVEAAEDTQDHSVKVSAAPEQVATPAPVEVAGA